MHDSHVENNIHNIAVVGRDGAGKTELVNALLKFQSKQAATDVIEQPEEKERGYTIYSSYYHFDNGGDTFNLIDTPGNTNFLSSLNVSVYASSGAVFAASVPGDPERAFRIWESLNKNKTPRAIFMNIPDASQGSFGDSLSEIETAFSVKPAVLYIPWIEDEKLVGIIDIISQKLIKGDSKKTSVEDLPEAAKDEVERYRSITYERLAELDDELMEYYIDEKPAPDELMVKVLSEGIRSCGITPVLVGSVNADVGVNNLFDFIKTNFPPFIKGAAWVGKQANAVDAEPVERNLSPEEPFSGVVFKTAFDRYVGKLNYLLVVSGVFKKGLKLVNSTTGRKIQTSRFYIMNGDKTDEIEEAYPGDIVVLEKVEDVETNQTICDIDNVVVYDPIPFQVPLYTNRLELTNSSKDSRIMDALNKTVMEDPTLTMEFNNETKEMLLSGIGLLHIDVTKERLKNIYDVEFNLAPPTVGHLETIKGKATVQGKYKKQSGGHGQYGDVHITVEPLPRDTGFEFVDKIVGGAIPRNYIPGVEKGVKEALLAGTLGGFPVVDVRVTLFDGTFHAVDSSDFAFQRAGSMAIKKAMPEAKPVLLEPIMELEIDVLEADVGKVTKDLSGRRGKVSNYLHNEFTTVIQAEAPLSEMMDYTPSLRGMTAGLGLYSMKLKSYEILAQNLTDKIMAAHKSEEE
ncbi:MAG: elongation factor G [Deltaproteobacteria bacterium]|jgi:elongation factor G|nr:elongation factor G [Deltaproteobacteria bacterium]MBT4264542.1 elongation factor G [Deltaproteobacteria bacterium]MBT4638477.1 elongation factor G [Deltaproteobacteria bacterium]MBT6500732.1 elongation factor G [Deltaproteobacteria bacterium]MBT6612844.1 elongation factor G [Deltaproteobacteria bacterium]